MNDHEFILEFADKNLLNFLKRDEKPQEQAEVIPPVQVSVNEEGEEEKKNAEMQIETNETISI